MPRHAPPAWVHGSALADPALREPPCPPTDTQRPVRRALVSVYDKTGLTDLAAALHAAGVEIVSTGSTAATIAATGVPGDPRRGPHRLPRVPRRARQDAAPARARRRAGRHPAAPSTSRSSTSSASSRSSSSSSTSTRSPRPWRPAPGPTSASSRSTSADPSMVRAAAKNHPSVAVVVDPARYDEVVAAVGAGGFTLAARRLLAADAFAHTAAYDAAVASWFAADVRARRAGRRLRLPGVHRDHLGARRGAALRREPAPAGRPLPDARRRRGPRAGRCRAAARQGDELQQLRRRRRRLARRARPRPTRPSRSSSTPTRAASRSARTSPTPTPRRTRATRSRRSAASSPPTAPSRRPTAEQIAPVFTEVVVAPGVRARGRSRSSAARRTSACCRSTPVDGVRTERRADQRRAARPGARPGRRPRRRPDDVDARGGRPGRRRDARRPGVRVAGGARREVERDPARRRRRLRRRRDGPGQPGRLVPARGRAGQRRATPSGPAGRSRPRTRSSRSPTALQVLLDAGVRAVVQPGGSVRDEEVIAAAQAAGVTLYLTGTRHFAH